MEVQILTVRIVTIRGKLLAPMQSQCSDVPICRPQPGVSPAVPSGDNTHRLSPHILKESLIKKLALGCFCQFT